MPDSLHDGNAPFALDDALLALLGREDKRAVCILPGIDADHVRLASRHALKTAIFAANDASEARNNGEYADDWHRTAITFQEAHRSLKRALAQMATGGSRTAKYDAHHLANPLAAMTSRIMPGEPLSVRHKWADDTAAQLLSAQKVLYEIAMAADAYQTQILDARRNEREFEKAAFVRVIAELWLHLTGRPPSPSAEANPFLKVADCAWADAGGWVDADGEQTSLVQAARQARSSLKEQPENAKNYWPWWLPKIPS